MKGWWVRYKFCSLASMAYGRARRGARTAGGRTWGFLLASAAPTCLTYLRRLLTGLSCARPRVSNPSRLGQSFG